MTAFSVNLARISHAEEFSQCNPFIKMLFNIFFLIRENLDVFVNITISYAAQL